MVMQRWIECGDGVGWLEDKEEEREKKNAKQ